MSKLFRLTHTLRRDPDVDAWFARSDNELRRFVQPWFEQMRGCGPDVREALHDGQPTACVGDVAFAYVSAFTAHANVGFFHGALLNDPVGLLEGTGKRLRHVKLRWGRQANAAALSELVTAAYMTSARVLRPENRASKRSKPLTRPAHAVAESASFVTSPA